MSIIHIGADQNKRRKKARNVPENVHKGSTICEARTTAAGNYICGNIGPGACDSYVVTVKVKNTLAFVSQLCRIFTEISDSQLHSSNFIVYIIMATPSLDTHSSLVTGLC